MQHQLAISFFVLVSPVFAGVIQSASCSVTDGGTNTTVTDQQSGNALGTINCAASVVDAKYGSVGAGGTSTAGSFSVSAFAGGHSPTAGCIGCSYRVNSQSTVSVEETYYVSTSGTGSGFLRMSWSVSGSGIQDIGTSLNRESISAPGLLVVGGGGDTFHQNASCMGAFGVFCTVPLDLGQQYVFDLRAGVDSFNAGGFGSANLFIDFVGSDGVTPVAFSASLTAPEPAPTPEPAPLPLMLAGLVFVAWFKRLSHATALKKP